jgi:hypothetical protein
MSTRPYYPHRHDADAAHSAQVLVRAGQLAATSCEIFALEMVEQMYNNASSVTQAEICLAHDVIKRAREAGLMGQTAIMP